MKRASYRAAIEWIARNDDCLWTRDAAAPISVSCALVADLFGVPDGTVRETIRIKYQEVEAETRAEKIRSTHNAGMMSKADACKLRQGDKVRVLVPGCGDVGDEGEEMRFAAGETLTVERVDTFRDESQGLSITVSAANGVVNVFDEGDFGGRYPFVLLDATAAGV